MNTLRLRHNNSSVLQILISFGADTSIEFPHPSIDQLQFAIHSALSVPIVKLLLSKGNFDLNHKSSFGLTALDYGKKLGCPVILRLLKEAIENQ